MPLDAIERGEYLRRVGDRKNLAPHTRVGRRHGGRIDPQVEQLSLDPAAAGERQKGIDSSARRAVETRTECAVEKHLFGHGKMLNSGIFAVTSREILDHLGGAGGAGGAGGGGSDGPGPPPRSRRRMVGAITRSVSGETAKDRRTVLSLPDSSTVFSTFANSSFPPAWRRAREIKPRTASRS